jgi:hypothetical protein
MEGTLYIEILGICETYKILYLRVKSLNHIVLKLVNGVTGKNIGSTSVRQRT